MDKAQIQRWLDPLDEDTTGADLEYDPTALELSQAANGRPETQFGAAEPPAWTTARELAESLFERNRDLRTAMLWTRAMVHLEGLEGLASGLFLLHGLLERFWDTLHPRPDPDDGDIFARISTLGTLDSLDGMLGDIRQSPLLADRRLGGLRMRDVEIALDRLPARQDEAMSTPGQIQGQIADNPDLAERLRVCVAEALASLKDLQSLMNDRFGMDSAVDIKQLRLMLTGVQSLLPSDDEAVADEVGGDDEAGSPDGTALSAGRRAAGGVHSVESRQDAVRAIQLVCAYLERSEPTNPAQLLLRRAERLIDKNFLQLIKDFAPDSMRDVARVLGIDPSSLDNE
ncbi:type VI secretion system protein TssA [Variovorax ginsengisoli]|uniref:Type VI secretion system protein ImpA n=1 Tax=Variovorax ginsengisoli TaxID=363844 RepID=A0ABT9S9K8_9BURK|nr:type VI secretion system protein TssA [Variovorax ginsengisoli]MDP9901048.1 type VI secretion system protein ImpA [Variovorax ginsengisoli]